MEQASCRVPNAAVFGRESVKLVPVQLSDQNHEGNTGPGNTGDDKRLQRPEYVEEKVIKETLPEMRLCFMRITRVLQRGFARASGNFNRVLLAYFGVQKRLDLPWNLQLNLNGPCFQKPTIDESECFSIRKSHFMAGTESGSIGQLLDSEPTNLLASIAG